MPAEVRIGISGWRYAGWRGTFYPPGLVHRRELEYAAEHFDTVEINGSFYSLQTPESYARWHDATPEDFCFAVKGGRFITHMKRLGDVDRPLANFFASGVLRLEEKIGPILWQLPPGLAFDEERVRSFFERLPGTTTEAASLARRHDHRVVGRSWTRIDAERPLRHAIEVRHPSFADPRFIRLLRRHGVALVVADTAGKWPYFEDVTADFIYVRLHGAKEIYVSGYGHDALRDWAKKIRAWRSGRQPPRRRCVSPEPPPRSGGRDVYVYFDNDVKVRAPFDALALRDILAGRRPKAAPAVEPRGGAVRTRWPGFRAGGLRGDRRVERTRR